MKLFARCETWRGESITALPMASSRIDCVSACSETKGTFLRLFFSRRLVSTWPAARRAMILFSWAPRRLGDAPSWMIPPRLFAHGAMRDVGFCTGTF